MRATPIEPVGDDPVFGVHSLGQENMIRDMVGLATQYGRYGYRRVTVLLRDRGWKVNHKRIEP